MIDSKSAPGVVGNVEVAETGTEKTGESRSRWKARLELERYRAETERLRVLADFLARPVHAHGGSDPDPDVVIAYNLAVEAALQGIRRASQGS